MPTDTAAQLTNIIDARVNRHLSPVEQPELLRMIISQIPLEGRSVARLVNRKWNACTTYTQREQNTILFNSTNVDTIDWLLHDPRVDPSIEYNKAIFLASATGQLDVVARLLKDPRVDPSDGGNRALIYASARGHLGVVDRLLQDPRVDPSDDDNDAIISASSRGHLAIVERLLRDPRVDPSDDGNWAIRIAVAFKRTEVAILLLQDPRVNPSDAILHASETGQFAVFVKMLSHPRTDITGIEDHLIKCADAGGPALLDHLCQDPRINPSAFRRACFEGNTAIISRLLSVTSIDPSADNNFAIRTASALGHLGVVERLLRDPRVDPSVDDNFAIRIASARGHSNVVKLFLNRLEIKKI